MGPVKLVEVLKPLVVACVIWFAQLFHVSSYDSSFPHLPRWCPIWSLQTGMLTSRAVLSQKWFRPKDQHPRENWKLIRATIMLCVRNWFYDHLSHSPPFESKIVRTEIKNKVWSQIFLVQIPVPLFISSMSLDVTFLRLSFPIYKIGKQQLEALKEYMWDIYNHFVIKCSLATESYCDNWRDLKIM